MRLEDLKKEYITNYTDYINNENGFDINYFDNLMRELNGEEEFVIDSNRYLFNDGFKETEDGPSSDYKLDDNDKAELLIGIFEKLSDERLKEEYLETMLSNTSEIPYKATEYFEKIKNTKTENINEDDNSEFPEEPEEEKENTYNSEDTSTEIEENELEEEKTEEKEKEEIANELKYDIDGPAIKAYKEETEKLKKELEDLQNTKNSINPEIPSNDEPLEILDNEINSLNERTNELDKRKQELEIEQELIDSVVNRIYNHSRIGTMKDDYENIVLAQERINNTPQREVDVELLMSCEKISSGLEELKNTIENNEPDKKLPITTIMNIKEEVSKIKDDKLKETLLKNVQFMIETIIKPVNERDFNEVYTKVQDSLTAIKNYHEILHRNNEVAKTKAKFQNGQARPYETLSDRNDTYTSSYEIEAELLRELRELGYHNITDEEISKLSGLQIESEVDRLLNQIMATKGQDELNSIATRIKNRNSGIGEEINSISQEKNDINNTLNDLESNKTLIENLTTRIDNVTPETPSEEIESIKEHIDFLNAPERVKEALNNRLNNKINNKEINIEDINSKIKELEEQIKDREEKTELYYSCLKDVQALDEELKNGLKIDSPEFKTKYEALGEKVKKLPKELAEEINQYLQQMMAKYTKGKGTKIDKVRKNPKLTWKTFAMVAGGLALGGGLGFALAATLGAAYGGVAAGAIAISGGIAKHKINKKRKELREKRLNGTLEIESVETPTEEQKNVFAKFKNYIKSEEGLRDLSWGLTGGIIGVELGYTANQYMGYQASLNQTSGLSSQTTTPQDYEIGQTIGQGDFSTGYRTANDALNGTGAVNLNENSVNATNEIKRMFVKGADGSWQNISTPGVKASDLIAQGYDPSDIAFSLANNGKDVAWMPYEQFVKEVAETAARTR